MAIKIPLDFFNEPAIKSIRRRDNGDRIVILYLRMLLLSKKNGGMIAWDHLEYSLASEIGLELDEDVNDIHLAIHALESVGLCSWISDYALRVFSPAQLRDRTAPEYKLWRNAVFERDKYTCRKCGKRGAPLNAHHVKPWAFFPELRYDAGNGITLCVECHKAEHKNRRADT